MINAAQLKLFAPRADEIALAPALDTAALAHGITTPRRVRHWMAQLHHESGGFSRLVESLNYSAEGLRKTWPVRFSAALATAIGRTGAHPADQRAIANQAYGGRMGNVAPDDGWRYRGRGLIQLTGKANYAAASNWSGYDLIADPDYAATPRGAALIAAAFWQAHGLNQVVDADADETVISDLHASIEANEDDDVRNARRIINGAALGLDDVRKQLIRAAAIWRD